MNKEHKLYKKSNEISVLTYIIQFVKKRVELFVKATFEKPVSENQVT